MSYHQYTTMTWKIGHFIFTIVPLGIVLGSVDNEILGICGVESIANLGIIPVSSYVLHGVMT